MKRDVPVATMVRLSQIGQLNPQHNPHGRSLTGQDAAWIGVLCLILGLILGACLAGATMP